MGLVICIILGIDVLKSLYEICLEWDKDEGIKSNLIGGAISIVFLLISTIFKGMLVVYFIKNGVEIPVNASALVKGAYYSIMVGCIIEVIMFIYYAKKENKSVLNIISSIPKLIIEIVSTVSAGVIGIKIFL
ncbi:hypothetical protein [Clostridium chrysemydis]|uniref:hypothetical protein n=1 Tax=Clostridium chrysemydis TaxID=2665504 RepID=UPI0018833A58|nr:hypothetical protein [Clostridium chrysemydis]